MGKRNGGKKRIRRKGKKLAMGMGNRLGKRMRAKKALKNVCLLLK
jgi:hypothetical protein